MIPQHLSFDVELGSAFERAMVRVKEALKGEGFGILTEIDLRETFREKLGRELRPFTILGACNPPLAFSAVSADPRAALLLPCNVIVEFVSEQRTMVRLTNPKTLLATAALDTSPQLASVALDAHRRMERVREALTANRG